MKFNIEKSLEKLSGVYKITNNINGKFYIGSAKCMKMRFYQHRRHLRNKNHDNGYLQNEYNKFGNNVFIFECLEHFQSIERSKLFKVEQKYITKYFDNGSKFYNLQKDISVYPENKVVQFTEQEIKYIKENYGKISAIKIANYLTCDIAKLYSFCYRNNIVSENIGTYKTKLIDNEQVFSTVNKYSAFWAGFILAGASVYDNNLFKIDLVESKKEKIFCLAQYLGYNEKFYVYKTKGVSEEQVRMSFHSQKIVGDLNCNFNIKPNKIDNFTIPTLNDYDLDFLKGFYWEKGAFVLSKTHGHILSFESKNIILLKYIKNVLNVPQIIWTDKKRKYHRLTIKGKKAVKFHELLSDKKEYL